ncbi:cupin domain-containing protein [Deinococcus sp.]|uniref:cupin domain-containing protein n=1 Tax=Deinococcus sp. TaxID=47478 RepID=UPI003CC5B341
MPTDLPLRRALPAPGASVLGRDDLPGQPTSRRFEGARYGNVGVSLFWLETPPGHGPALHEHPYAEVFVVQAGEATFTVQGVQYRVSGGEMVVVPPRCPHRFTNHGPVQLQLIAIHASAQMQQTWLSE